MVRLIKRYDSRKLYDTEESRYVAVDEIADWIRSGQEVQVMDNRTSEDVTAQTLAQIILDEGRNGSARLPNELMHDLVRMGGKAISTGVESVQHGVDRFVQASMDRITPIRQAREEMTQLKQRLEDLERSLNGMAPMEPTKQTSATVSKKKATKRKTTRKKAAPRKTRPKK